MTLDPATAARFARLTLGHVGREYPNKLDHLLNGPADVTSPRALHPIFYGSFDWHSCVHGWWQLLAIARACPDLPEAREVRARADAMLTPALVAGERAYLDRPNSASFERPYGWAWALALHGEAARHDAGWGAALEPLARAFAARFMRHLPLLTYPIRTGTHFNTAFALILARKWAGQHDPVLLALIDDRARGWFAGDADCPAWEPGGDEFLSPSLCEAVLMAAVLGDGFVGWLDRFLPGLGEGRPATLFVPAIVSDRSDPKIAHLDGLNLSRAWCWTALAGALGPGHAAHSRMEDAAAHHLAAALPHLDDDYAGEHWLATFALLALMERDRR